MRWSLALLFFCFACQSKPVIKAAPEAPSPSPQQMAKVTREAPSATPAEHGSRVLTAPRKAQELETGLLGHPEIRKCVDQATVDPTFVFDVILEGQISGDGTLGVVKISKASKGFELCMTPALKAVNLGTGKAGAFKMQLFRKASKNPIKKFE